MRVEVDVDSEVLTASNHNLDGYWEQAEATAEAQRGEAELDLLQVQQQAHTVAAE